MITQLGILLLSLAVMIALSNVVIRSAVRIAKVLHMDEFSVGFVLMAVLASFPELMISTTASYNGLVGISIGNVLGANITNILLVLGTAVAIRGVKVRKKELIENAEILLLMTLAPLIFFLRGTIGFYDGLVLLVLFVVYAFFVARRGYKAEEPDEDVDGVSWLLTSVAFCFGAAAVVVVASYVVSSASALASALGVPDTAIAVTIIAFGTSLPELAIAVGAVRHGHTSLALGEVLGSNVVNLTLVLGLAAVISPLKADYEVFAATIASLIAIYLFVWYFLVKHSRLKKEHGVFFLLVYLVFLASQVLIEVI